MIRTTADGGWDKRGNSSVEKAIAYFFSYVDLIAIGMKIKLKLTGIKYAGPPIVALVGSNAISNEAINACFLPNNLTVHA